MAIIKILKNGETDIESTDISKFALHSQYKCQKIAAVGSASIVLPAGSSWLDGGSYSAVINHGLGYIPLFWAFVEHSGKGYESVGNANPQIDLASGDGFPVGAAFNIDADSSNLNIEIWPTGFGETANNETFTIRAFFILDEIV
ncbi:MAG: hypothetical protein RBT05_08280 [Bacteroidales bacterium]|jgi:hypothetical protein|nr:hypothetical protein [Bacteroidales bacterium]